MEVGEQEGRRRAKVGLAGGEEDVCEEKETQLGKKKLNLFSQTLVFGDESSSLFFLPLLLCSQRQKGCVQFSLSLSPRAFQVSILSSCPLARQKADTRDTGGAARRNACKRKESRRRRFVGEKMQFRARFLALARAVDLLPLSVDRTETGSFYKLTLKH